MSQESRTTRLVYPVTRKVLTSSVTRKVLGRSVYPPRRLVQDGLEGAQRGDSRTQERRDTARLAAASWTESPNAPTLVTGKAGGGTRGRVPVVSGHTAAGPGQPGTRHAVAALTAA